MKFLIEERRKACGMTQDVLAKRSGVCRATISGLESGRIRSTSTFTLEQIALALNVPVRDLIK